MSIWGGFVKPDAPLLFDCEDGSLDLTHATLISGTSALLSVHLTDGRRFAIGRLTSSLPNLKTQLLFEEDVKLSVDGKDTEIAIVGNVRSHSFPNNFETEEETESENESETYSDEEISDLNAHIAKVINGLKGSYESDEDEEENEKQNRNRNVSKRIVEVTDEEAEKINAERVQKRKQKQDNITEKNEESSISNKRIPEKTNAVIVSQDIAKKPPLGSQLNSNKKRKLEAPNGNMQSKKLKTVENVKQSEAPISNRQEATKKKDDHKQSKKDSAPQLKQNSNAELKNSDAQPIINKETTNILKKKDQTEGKTSQASAKIEEKEKSNISPGVLRELAGGVKYEVMKVGQGKIATVGKRVRVKYEGRLSRNGKRFDSGTLDFTVGGGDMIKGFDLGTRGMLVGEKRRVFIPSRLAYGKQKVGGIPPNSDLTFEISLLSTS